jgi:hypothetical protein
MSGKTLLFYAKANSLLGFAARFQNRSCDKTIISKSSVQKVSNIHPLSANKTIKEKEHFKDIQRKPEKEKMI